MFKKTKIGLAGVIVLAWGCANNGSNSQGGREDGEDIGTAGLHLSTGLDQSADVEGISFEVTPVDCDSGAAIGPALVETRELEDFKIPGGDPTLENNPLDEDSAHFFADAFFGGLEPGCYDVVTTPVQATGEPSQLCSSASQKGVEVFAGETTEITLINQCRGADSGNLDVISTLNHEPEIEDIEIRGSKFTTCDEQRVICVTASDPDGDPLEFVWSVDPAASGPTPLSSTTNPETGAITECVSLAASEAGEYTVTVTVYDQLWDEGSLIRIEDFLAAEGYPHPSHASSEFPIHVVDCDEKCVDTIDVVMLHDLSGSFRDDLDSLKVIAPTLFSSLVAAAPDARLGVASFVDKPIFPMGGPGDWVFRIEPGGELTADLTTFVTAVNGMATASGIDIPESQIEGLMHVGTHAAALGYRPTAKKYVIMMTDAPYHVAGDCQSLSMACPNPNDGDDVIELDEDYPKIEQIANALIAADITPHFAVTSDVVANYQTLSMDLTALGVKPGNVVPLAPDSSNLIDVTLDLLECPPL